MKTQEVKGYRVWLNSENMHESSLKWLSELEFAKDEQLFFNDLIKSYTLQLIDSEHFEDAKKMSEQISKTHDDIIALIEAVKHHENGLEIMVDGLDQYEEEQAYRDEHRDLILKINAFLDEYKDLKKELFILIKGVIKEGKQKRLL
ncbi:hypothetical protein [Aestuariibaculum suncheonense]|uniref:Uncharacterized protein n=1 Tax=Aestuariibaculum suncheonense TaxID=1028745 RepID=A0A8J6UBN4_9FLAO|nr:hypothetical protein [Aestuariibaculum suncheonense]MBD0836055.1 hypothetical protein [Aestuariibaculum suncheonense]